MIRVIHLVSGDAWGGLEVMVLDLLSSKVYRTRTDTTMVVLNEGMLASCARARGLRVIVVPESAMSFIALVRGLRRVIEELRPDIIHSHRYKEMLLGAILSPTVVSRHVITIHGYEPPTSLTIRLKSIISNTLCVGSAIARGGNFIVVADHLRECFNIPRYRCRTIHNGIQISNQHPCVRTRLPMDDSRPPIIGWVGRMVSVKGLSTLLKAVAQMVWIPSPVLLLIGDGPERVSLELLAKTLGISERVHFQGFVEDARPFYKQMDLFALPSLHEGIPIALLEALGAGLPVVASAVGGIPQVLSSSGAGILIDSRSPSIWAKAMTDLVKDRHRMKALGECARRHVQDNFSVEGMASRYIAMYESINLS